MISEKKSRLLHDFNLKIIFAITLMAVMGVSSISPILPKVKDVFDVSKEEVGYLIVAFTLPGIFLAPFLGVM
ncbi:MAG: hypothetical protein K9G47_09830, partial [Bacteroidales bacterium]|nr:hypothetical protein [Bacteroidales bacterium]